MLLSKKLTFYFVFSVLLVAAFAFIVTPAMAEVVKVTAQVTERVNAAAGSPPVQGKRVVTIKYSVNAWPELKKADITTNGTAALADGVGFEKVDAKTFRLTFLGTTNGVTDANISSIQIDGYAQVAGSALNGDSDGLVADPVTKPAARTINAAANHLAGGAYLVIAGNNTPVNNASVFPTLPALTPAITKRSWADHDGVAADAAMPDLYTLFQVNGGGTLNLSVKYNHDRDDGTTPMVRFGSLTGDPLAPNADHGRNQRWVVINEVMWAYDNARVGQTDKIRQQWIELHNRSTRPFPYAGLILTSFKAFPAPKAETDRLSNIPSYTNTWSMADKGKHGNSGDTDAESGNYRITKRCN